MWNVQLEIQSSSGEYPTPQSYDFPVSLHLKVSYRTRPLRPHLNATSSFPCGVSSKHP